MRHIKKILAIIIMVCSMPMFANSQNTIDVAEIIHAFRLDKAENGLFYDARNQITELKQWTFEHVPDTIYAIESWSLEEGIFALMYWDRDTTISVKQDNPNDSLIAYNRRAFTKRIIALVEEWNPREIINHYGRVSPSNNLYATRIIINEHQSIIVNTLCFPEIFMKEDIEDAMELFKIWHYSKVGKRGLE